MSYGQLWTPEPWYYRNPLAVVLAFSGLYTPHGSTIRATYTVPAGRAVRLHGVATFIIRTAVAAPAGGAQTLFTAVGVGNLLSTDLVSTLNTINDRVQRELDSGAWFGAGRVLQFTTTDGSTGGSMIMTGSAHATEYDAI